MKYLKYIIGVLLILPILFILFGVIKPKVSYDCEITVEKSLSESWAVAQDPDKMKDWIPGFKKMVQISGTHGTVGAVADVYFDSGGQEMIIRETITEIKPNESISMTYTSDFMNMDYQLSMDQINGSTKVSSSTTTTGNGIFSKSMVALMGGSIKAQEETNLVNLKKTIEDNKKVYSSAIQ